MAEISEQGPVEGRVGEPVKSSGTSFLASLKKTGGPIEGILWSGSVVGVMALFVGVPTFLIYKAIAPKKGPKTNSALAAVAIVGAGLGLLYKLDKPKTTAAK